MRSCSRGRYRSRSRSEAALVGVVVALTACGGAGATQRASAICTREGTAMRRAGDYQHRLHVAQRELRELRALQEPRLAPLVRALAREVDMADRLRIAATIGDTETAEGAYHLGRVAARRAKRAAATLGVAGCG